MAVPSSYEASSPADRSYGRSESTEVLPARLNPTAPAGKPEAVTPKPAAEAGKEGSGRVVHDSRGNAIWDWVKETGRICIDSTSAMLKKLEVPGLKMEGEKDDELRLESDRDKGGGYDPYNQRKPVPKSKPPGKK
jgi:hypothetical protein